MSKLKLQLYQRESFPVVPRSFNKPVNQINIKYNIIYLMNRYKILKSYQNHDITIGLGSYGQVKLAKDLKSGDIVAIKIINKIAKSEASLHSTLSHTKIVQLINIHIDFAKQISYIVLQYVKGGTFFDKIKQKKMTKLQIKQYFRDVCEGVDYLHSQKIIHRDVKPENILLSEKNEAKVCDFGAAALNFNRMTVCGTYEYMAPQMIQKRPYDQKIDIWALMIGNSRLFWCKCKSIFYMYKFCFHFFQKKDD